MIPAQHASDCELARHAIAYGQRPDAAAVPVLGMILSLERVAEGYVHHVRKGTGGIFDVSLPARDGISTTEYVGLAVRAASQLDQAFLASLGIDVSKVHAGVTVLAEKDVRLSTRY